jgi:1-acyl-sn-glycerol-3-phosphate acyltransferase
MLEKGTTIGIFVGGEQEQLLSRYGEHTAYIQKRKGFIKLALKFGVPVVPCYCFGETDLYYQSGRFINFRVWVAKKFGIALVLAVGRSWLMPWLPNKVKLIQVVGEPLYPSKLKVPGEPSNEEIDALHAKYVEGLKKVFDENKAKCGYPNAVLNIV